MVFVISSTFSENFPHWFLKFVFLRGGFLEGGGFFKGAQYFESLSSPNKVIPRTLRQQVDDQAPDSHQFFTCKPAPLIKEI